MPHFLQQTAAQSRAKWCLEVLSVWPMDSSHSSDINSSLSRCARCRTCGLAGEQVKRWAIGYEECYRCERAREGLKNNCPVCLQEYELSDTSPMIECDDCSRWVHIRVRW